jgi:hypothetical protein
VTGEYFSGQLKVVSYGGMAALGRALLADQATFSSIWNIAESLPRAMECKSDPYRQHRTVD